MTYKLVTATSPDDLVSKVNDWLNQGWELQGGVSVATYIKSSGPESGLYQAMFKR